MARAKSKGLKKPEALVLGKSVQKKLANDKAAKREVLFRPHRHAYVRGQDKPAHCVFCAALANGLNFESLLVFKSKHAMVLLNKYPYNNGHLLVLPTRHVSDIGLLEKHEYQELMNVLRLSVAIMQKALQPQGINMGLNLGAAAGAGLPDHVHFHLIPRWAGDTNFFPLIAETKVISQSLEQTYEVFRPAFDKIPVKDL